MNAREGREEQSKAFVTCMEGPRQAVWSAKGDRIQWETWLLVLKWLEGKGKFQVQLENGLLVAVTH